MRWRKERKKIGIIYRPSAALISKYLHRPEKKPFRSTSRFDQMNLKGIVQSKINILSTFNFVHTVIAIECCSSQYFIVFSRVKESYSGLNNTVVITELSILRQTIPLYVCVCVCVCVFYSDLVCHIFRSFTQSWVSSLCLCGNESATLIQLNTHSQFRLLLFYWSSLICPFNSLVYPSNLALLSFSASWKTEPGSFSPVTVWRLQGCLESLTNVIFNPANGIEGVIMVPMWLNSCLYVAIHQRKTILWCVSNLWWWSICQYMLLQLQVCSKVFMKQIATGIHVFYCYKPVVRFAVFQSSS